MDGSKILWRVSSLHHHNLDPRAAIVLDLVPRASALQADEARLLDFWKISFQARVMSISAWIEEIWPEGSDLKEILWQLPSLHSHSSSHRGPIDLDSFSRASAYQALGAGLLNFWKIAFRTRVMAIWKWIDKKWHKSPNFETNFRFALFELCSGGVINIYFRQNLIVVCKISRRSINLKYLLIAAVRI